MMFSSGKPCSSPGPLRPAGVDITGSSDVHSPSWTTVVKRGRRVSLPLFAPEDDIPLSNCFTPLSDYLAEPAAACPRRLPEQQAPVQFLNRKRRTPPSRRFSSGSSPFRNRDTSPTSKRPQVTSPPALSSSSPLCPAAAMVSRASANSLTLHPTTAAAQTASPLVFTPPECILLGDSMVRSVAIPKGTVLHIPLLVQKPWTCWNLLQPLLSVTRLLTLLFYIVKCI